MENNGSSLKIILEKTAFFSDRIDKLHELAQDVNKEKKNIAKNEDNLQKDLLSTAETMHKFLYETISKMTDLYEEIEKELENNESGI